MVAVSVPAGTVTFLLTDIEGSTVRWERHPQAMRRALARHDALLHDGIAAHGGVVLTERGEGDSFFALFARASDALAAACALQQALAAEAWPSEVAPLRVRMALHTGEAGLRAGADYRGAAPSRCARLRAVAHGGQVLLSGATYALVCATLPDEASLRDLGIHRLKDLMQPEHIYQLVHPALPAEFAPLASLDERLRRLPVQLTSLVGREREVEAVRSLLLEEGARLLTLTGPGGVGKTRLALQAAAEAVEAFPDGVHFVNLAPVGDPALVLPTIAQALGVVEQAGQSLVEALRARLRGTRSLLLLDNFEQVLDAAPEMVGLLEAGPGVVVLATSRAALRVRGEQTYAVPPLTLPSPDAEAEGGEVPLETLTQAEAVRLFVVRARAAQPGFVLTNQTAPAVAAICARLDGLPLAIELAAARIRLLPPAALAARLGSRLRVVTGGARDLPARQQTLRATIDWSYNLLTRSEQRLFARLGVFVGGCTLEAAEAICAADDADVLEEMEALVAQSLLRPEDRGAGSEGGSGVGETRVVLLETIREYALERLAASGEADALRRAHARYYLALAEQAEPALRGVEQGVGMWLERLEREHDNLRAALAWCQDQAATAETEAAGEAAEVGLRLGGALWRFWGTRGYLSEGRRWLDALLAARVQGKTAALARARALSGAGVLVGGQGDHERANALQEEALALYRELGDRGGIAGSLNGLGNLASDRGDYARERALHEESLALFRELGDKWGMAISLHNLGANAAEQGDYMRATVLTEEALALERELGNKLGIAGLLHILGAVAADSGNVARATALIEEALALFRELGHRGSIAGALQNLGAVIAMQDDFGRAAPLFEEALALFRELGDRRGIAGALQNVGRAAVERGDLGRASAASREGLALCRTLGDRWLSPHCVDDLAAIAAAQGQPERAARLFGAAEAMRYLINIPLPPGHRPYHERKVAAARDRLDAEAFAAAWAAGEALPWDQAVAEALGER